MGEVLRPASATEPQTTIPRRNAGFTSGETTALREVLRRLVGAEPSLTAELAGPVFQALLRQEQQYALNNDGIANQSRQTRSRFTRRAGLAGGLGAIAAGAAVFAYQHDLSPESQKQKKQRGFAYQTAELAVKKEFERTGRLGIERADLSYMGWAVRQADADEVAGRYELSDLRPKRFRSGTLLDQGYKIHSYFNTSGHYEPLLEIITQTGFWPVQPEIFNKVLLQPETIRYQRPVIVEQFAAGQKLLNQAYLSIRVNPQNPRYIDVFSVRLNT